MRGNQDTLEYGRGSYTFSRMYNILRAPRDRGGGRHWQAPQQAISVLTRPPARRRRAAEAGSFHLATCVVALCGAATERQGRARESAEAARASHFRSSARLSLCDAHLEKDVTHLKALGLGGKAIGVEADDARPRAFLARKSDAQLRVGIRLGKHHAHDLIRSRLVREVGLVTRGHARPCCGGGL